MEVKEDAMNSSSSNNENETCVNFSLSQEDDNENNSNDHKETCKSSSLSLLKTRSGRCIKYNSDYLEKNLKKRERQNLIYQIKKALGKNVPDRTQDDLDLLKNFKDLVHEVDLSARNRQNALQHQEIVVDDQETLQVKCQELASAIFNSKGCVIYTGAGISTSASIPDYRGPNGLWTMLERGVKIEMPDFALVDPTYSHMALNSMMKLDLVKYIVSQNCDGLHLRSGIDLNKLSELHGNCFIEFCPECYQDYIRDFDVTERTTFRKHSTGRFCKDCTKISEDTKKYDQDSEQNEDNKSNRVQLRDSIIHFGEKLRNGPPYNWESAKEAVKNADLIICLGSSLKVLKHYPCLWPKKKTTQLYIVNIQWTPKDTQAKLKIHGYCDEVLKLVVQNLQEIHKVKNLKINSYNIKTDPLFKYSIKLKQEEMNTTSKIFLASRKSNTKKEQSVPASLCTSTASTNSWYNKSFKPKNIKKSKSCLQLKQETTTEDNIESTSK